MRKIKMRFKTRFDRWMVAMYAVIGLIFCSLPVLLYFPLKAQGLPIWLPFFFPVLFVLLLSLHLPQYYEFREGSLYIRQGWRKVQLPYSAILELRVWNSGLSAPVLSTHRLVVATSPGMEYVIAVDQQEQFLSEIERRSPQLERCSSGLRARCRLSV